jgi:cytochrome d ubiquinol oxidase subunit I
MVNWNMDIVLLSRIQFALTIAFHYIYPPLSIGLGAVLVIMEGLYLATGRALYLRMAKFWVRVFGLTFALGVATGIVMEFEFGTNWARYSRYVGDVFGSALAAEGIFAFFLESGFLALLLFGWNRIGKKLHFFATLMVAFGAHFSAIWIVVANSWMQTPAGFHVVEGAFGPRAEVTDFWAMVLNPSMASRLTHTVLGCWQAGAYLVVSVAAYYLLRGRHREFAMSSLRIGLAVAVVAGIGTALTGHASAEVAAEYQPAKLAAMEAHYEENSPADLYLFGIVDEETESVRGLAIPGGVGWLLGGDANTPVRGLRSFEPEDRPPVAITFYSFHLMVGIGTLLLLLAVASLVLDRFGRLETSRTVLWLLVLSVLGPQVANQLGWVVAEVGRQPWIVYGLMRTHEGVSGNVAAAEVLASLVLFTLVYTLLFALFIYLLDQKIRHGPGDTEEAAQPHRA